MREMLNQIKDRFEKESGIVVDISVHVHQVDNRDMCREKAESIVSQFGEVRHVIASDGSVAWAQAESEKPGLRVVVFYPAEEYDKKERWKQEVAPA